MPKEYLLMAKKSGSLTKYVELKRRYLKSTYRCMRFDLGPHVDALACLGSASYIPLHNLNHGVNNLFRGCYGHVNRNIPNAQNISLMGLLVIKILKTQ